jgi:hypothetical protein
MSDHTLFDPKETPMSVPAVITERPSQLTPTGEINQVAAVTNLIQFAIENKTDPAALEKLVDLQMRVMAIDAKAKFDAAKNAFQAECPVIGANRSADIPKGPKYNYADLEKITTTIRPLLERHGFSYSFSQKHCGDIIEVTCHLRHEAGHEEQTTFSGPWATNAGMSAIQKYAAATTFCQRYALRMALGLPVGEDDEERLPPEEAPPTARDETKPKAPTRGQRREPGVTADEMRTLCTAWVAFTGLDKFDAAEFSKWADNMLSDDPPKLNPTTPAAWPTILRKDRYDRLMEKLP